MYVAGRPVASDMHELDAPVSKASGSRGGLRRNIRGLCSLSQWQAVLPRNSIGEHITTREFLGFYPFSLDTEWHCMRDKLTRPHCRIEFLATLGCLSVPILKDLLHDPSGGRPDG